MIYRSLNLVTIDYKKEGDTETFRVYVSDSPVGGMTKSEAVLVSLPADLRVRLRRLERRLLTRPDMIRLGEDLADALFPPRVRRLLDRSKAALAESEGLRIRLMLDGYDLADIPWEYMYIADPDTPEDQKNVRGFLALDRRISILRDLILEQPRGTLTPVPNQALRMVVLLSNPTNTAELDLAKEQKNIEEALKDVADISVQFYPDATIGALESALRTEAHIFHYSGHGNFKRNLDSEGGEGSLSLTASGGGEEAFSATDLSVLLNGRGVRLALLGACESSRVDRINAWTGIAPALMSAGIPAVVGMQFSVRDEHAVAFSNTFYQGLAAGQPIDEAVSAGRQSILFRRLDNEDRDWGVPVLYLRAQDDGILFPRPADAASSTLDQAREQLKGKLSGLKADFQDSLQQIDVVKDYKDLHDNLHDLQFGWLPLVRQKVVGLPDAKGAVFELISHERDLRSVIGKLNDTLKKNKVAITEKTWIDDLEAARVDLKKGVGSPEPQMDLINAALAKTTQVLETQPTFINGNLMRAVGALRLAHLIGIVQRVFDESIANDRDKELVQRFEEGIRELKQIDADLVSLTKEHDTWQRNEGKLGMIMLVVTNLSAFEVLWAQLKADVSHLYQNSSEEWAEDLRSDAAAIDQACKDKTIENVSTAFTLFIKDAKERFWNVDKLIKQKCESLAEIRSKMETV